MQPTTANKLCPKLKVELFDDPVTLGLINSGQKIVDFFRHIESDATGYSLRQQHWPKLPNIELTEQHNVTLNIVPMERLGIRQGMSGNRVVACYFDAEIPGASDVRSNPFLLKVGTKPKRVEKLEAERDNCESIQEFISHPDNFVFPLSKFDWIEGDSSMFLWAPFRTSSASIFPDKTDWLSVKDFRGCLDPNEKMTQKKASGYISDIYGILRYLHSRKTDIFYKESRNIIEEYEWYLRGLVRRDKDGRWIISRESATFKNFSQLWPSEEPTIEFQGTHFPNPFRLLGKIIEMPSVPLTVGAIHGDLHPRNILLSAVNQPCFIDFGWANPKAHIAKDYVLLECNLRFVETIPCVKQNDQARLAETIGYGQITKRATSSLENQYAKRLSSMIAALRREFHKSTDENRDWIVDYQIPLFLTALGLLRFFEDFKNQNSAILSILNLSQQLESKLS